MTAEADTLPMGGMDAGRHSPAPYCCAGLSVTRSEIPLIVGRLSDTIRDNDRLYMQLFEASDKRVVVAMTAAKEAMQTALAVVKESGERTEKATEKRFDEVSEKLDTLRDTLSTQITTATKAAALTAGRSGGLNAGWIYLIGAVSLGSMVFNIVLTLTAK